MTVVKMHEAKSQLSRLLAEVESGEEIVIVRGNKPIARLIPYHPGKSARKPGFLIGKIEVAADFDAPLPTEIVKGFGATVGNGAP